jgi:flagellin FlaB
MISVKNNDEGFTGLEAAIVLIAFVVVAAVFSYVVLGAGFFTTQKSQEVVHTGVQQASSTLQIVGNVVGTGTAGTSIDSINFSVALAPGGTPVDFEKMTMTFSKSTGVVTLIRHTTIADPAIASQWSIVAVQNGATTDWLLEKGEQFDIMAMPPAAMALTADTEFNLEIKPIVGASLAIKRTTPAAIHAVNILY